MEQYYYNRMNKIEQAVYHALYQGFLNIDEEIQIPRLEGEALYNVFFKLRLDRPEIFWATGYKYKYYNDSPNLIFVPEYLFEKAKIKENQKPETKLHATHRERTKPEKQNRWISGTIILTWMIKTFSGITNHCCIRLQHATRADATIIKKRNCHLQR